MKQKNIYAAPIQGWTDHVWRSAHAQVFGGIDAYFAPFMRVEHGKIRTRDIKDIDPQNNQGLRLVPQVLASRPDQMEQMLKVVEDFGYDEVNINLGCPHPPVVRKGYGLGMLMRPDALRQMMSLLSQFKSLRISLKLRLGWDDISQWKCILPLLEENPVEYIVMHYRTGIQQYKGEAMLEYIPATIESTKTPIVVNGDIESDERLRRLFAMHPQVAGGMIGRALVSNPALLSAEKAMIANYRTFHTLLYDQYCAELTGGNHQILSKMQSLWERMFLMLDNHRARKAIRKASSLSRYEQAVDELFESITSEPLLTMD